MRRLFWRIFFSFWLLLIAFALVLVVLDPGMVLGPRGMNPALMAAAGQRPLPPPRFANPPYGSSASPGYPPPGPGGTGGPGPFPPGGPPPPNSGPLAQQVIQAFDSGGPKAVDSLFENVRRRTGLQLYLFDSRLDLVSGDAATSGVQSLAEQALRSGHMQVSAGNGVVTHADTSYAANGNVYVMVDVATPGRIDYIAAGARIVMVVAIATVVCWWLSRQITLPIVALRLAARDLAAGRFQTRVLPRLGDRRDEIADLAADFDTMASRLDSMVGAQTRLLGDVSHELRSPLARLSVASAIARRNTGVEGAAALDRVDREARRLSELIGQLLVISKLEVDATGQIRRPFDLAALLLEVCSDAQFEAEGRGIKIDLNATEESVALSGNRELLRSAVENIVRNALRYTEPSTAVEVNLTRRGDNWVIVVRDHGLGVAASDLTSIFRPFFRTAESRGRETGGVGLGLAIAERAIARHGGAIWAENADSGGLVVTISLPVR